MGRSKAAQERRRVGKMFCLFLLLAAVVMFSRQRMMQLGFTAEAEGKAREKEAFHVGQQYHSSIGGRDKDNYILEFFE